MEAEDKEANTLVLAAAYELVKLSLAEDNEDWKATLRVLLTELSTLLPELELRELNTELVLLTELFELELKLFMGATCEVAATWAVHILTNATTSSSNAIPSTVFLCNVLYLRGEKCLTMYITVCTKTDSSVIP